MEVSGGHFSGEPSELFAPSGMPVVLFAMNWRWARETQ